MGSDVMMLRKVSFMWKSNRNWSISQLVYVWFTKGILMNSTIINYINKKSSV